MSLFSSQSTPFRFSRFAKVATSLFLGFMLLVPLAMPLVVAADDQSGAGNYPVGGTLAGPPNGVDGKTTIGYTLLDACKPLGGSFSFSNCMAGIIYFLFVGVTSLLAAIAGYFFDFTTAIALTANTYSNVFINQAWTIARDLANMVFVFLLIFLAFTLILDIAHAGVGKQLAKIIAVALLINFSFFFTRVIIDASNIISHAFYDAIAGRAVETGGAKITAGTQELRVKSLSENIMNGINAQRLFDDNSTSGFNAFRKELDNKSGVANFFLLATVFIVMGGMNIILIFIFLAVGIQMIGRVVRLWLVIMLSPIGFITWIIPGLGSLSKKWWDTLLHAAFFAPAFMLCIYITIRLTAGTCVGGTCSGGLLSGLSFGVVAGAQYVEQALMVVLMVVIRLAIVVALLFASLKVGDYFGQTSAKAVMSNAQKYGGMAGRYSGAGFAARWTLGYGANAADKALKNSRWANAPISGALGYRLRKYITEPMAKKEYFGTESFKARTERSEKEMAERFGNLETIKNKKLVKEAGDQTAWNAKSEAEKEQARKVAQGFNKSELEVLAKSGTLAPAAHLLSQKQIEGLEKSVDEGKITREEFIKIRASFENRTTGSSDATINIIDKQTKDMRKIEVGSVASMRTAGISDPTGEAAIDTILYPSSDPDDPYKAVGTDDFKAAEKALRARAAAAAFEARRATTAGEKERAVEMDTLRRNTEDQIEALKKIQDNAKKLTAGSGNLGAYVPARESEGDPTEAGKYRVRPDDGARVVRAPAAPAGGAGPAAGGGGGAGGAPRMYPLKRPTPSGRTELGMGAKSSSPDTRDPNRPTIQESAEIIARERAGESDNTPPDDGGDDTTPPSSPSPTRPGGGPLPVRDGGDFGGDSALLASDVSEPSEPGEVLRSFNTPLREGVGVNEPEKAILKDEYEKMRQGLSNPDTLTPFDLLPPDQVSKLKQTRDKYERLGTSLGEAVRRNPEFADKLGRHQERIRSFTSQIRELDSNRSELEAAGQTLPELEKQRKELEEGRAREAEAYTRTLDEGLRPFAPKSEVAPPAPAPAPGPQSRAPSSNERGGTSRTPLASSSIPQVGAQNVARTAPSGVTNGEQFLPPRVSRVENERVRTEANRQVGIHEVGSRIASVSQQTNTGADRRPTSPVAPANPDLERERARTQANAPTSVAPQAPAPAQPQPTQPQVERARSANDILPPIPQQTSPARVSGAQRIAELRRSAANDNRPAPLSPNVRTRTEQRAERNLIHERIIDATAQPPVPPAPPTPPTTSTPPSPPPPKNEDLAA